jgi:hypothetical protein
VPRYEVWAALASWERVCASYEVALEDGVDELVVLVCVLSSQ